MKIDIAYVGICFLVDIVTSISWNPPERANIGLIVPKFTDTGEADSVGAHVLAACMMALEEINNKTDGLAENFLPDTGLFVTVESPLQTTSVRRNYLAAVDNALFLSNVAFNRTGVLAVIGTIATESSKATAEIFANADHGIPQISYGAESSELSHLAYGYFSRTCPTDAHQGQVIAQLLSKKFLYQTVTIFYTGDTYGNDITMEFEGDAALFGMNIESKFSFWSGTKDLTSVIEACKAKGGVLKVFVLLMKSYDTAVLLEQGYKLGLSNEGTQIIGTQYMAHIDTMKAMSPDANVEAIMKGAIAVIPTLSAIRREYSTSKSFVKRYRAQKDTLTTDENGLIRCDKSKDSDGDYIFIPKSGIGCAGVNFHSLAEDGSDIPDMALYAYDATYAITMALHIAMYKMNGVNVTGDVLRDVLLHNVSFVGASGNIDFDEGNDGFDKYERGNRLQKVDFQILNFDLDSYHARIWSHKLKYVPCDVNINANDTCSKWVFNTADGKPVIDESPIVEV
eukprot:gene7552-15480_t